MGNIVDYAAQVRERFLEKPFGPVDSLILSQLSYLDFEGLVPGPGEGRIPFSSLSGEEAVQAMTEHARASERNRELVQNLLKNPRFSEMYLGGYVNIVDKEAQEQFSAVTFFLDGGAYVAYRGTDASYVAWKEDFNLAFTCPVPSQVAGAGYLDWTASVFSGPLRVGGHSKGGNIAVYSALFCGEEAKARIQAVYSHDGPGFSQGVLDSPEFARMGKLLHKTMPQSSLVGVLLQHQENYRVIRSDEFWIMQHDPFSWVVENGDFCYLESLSSGALFLDQSLNGWISSLSKEELSDFADALYKVLCALPGDTFSDLPDTWWDTVRETLNGLKGMDPGTYACILRTVGALFSLAMKNLPRPKLPLTPPEVHLPEIPKPRPVSLPSPVLPESLLEKLPFRKKAQSKDNEK